LHVAQAPWPWTGNPPASTSRAWDYKHMAPCPPEKQILTQAKIQFTTKS
jgi:hypothetical protein